ncbi:MAG: hypothetical protein CSB44_00230 [Gammaproteobacteria bacterium]|nr:MAG: hypothetical protein CSB44_00230 [Gammaproteobacteria bacterium]
MNAHENVCKMVRWNLPICLNHGKPGGHCRTRAPGWVAALALAFLPLAAPAAAGQAECSSELGAVTIGGNLQVTGNCRLEGTVVSGNLLVDDGASLITRGASIGGNLVAEAAGDVDISETAVGGSIRLIGLVGADSVVRDSSAGGNIQLDDNSTRLTVEGNSVGGNVTAYRNTSGLSLTANAVGGSLRCEDNAPAPTGSANDVRGVSSGQCADSAMVNAGGNAVGAVETDTGSDLEPPLHWTDAPGADNYCDGPVGDIYVGGNIHVAAPGCELLDTTVMGSVYVYSGGSLSMNESFVAGRLVAADAFELEVVDSLIQGDIEIDRLVGEVSAVGSVFGSNVRFDGNGYPVSLRKSTVTGNVRIAGNSGGVAVVDNVIGGNLDCERNDPVVTGSANLVYGTRRSQCESLQFSDDTAATSAGVGEVDVDTDDSEVGVGIAGSEDGGSATVDVPTGGGSEVGVGIAGSEDGGSATVDVPTGSGSEVGVGVAGSEDGGSVSVDVPTGGGSEVGVDVAGSEDGGSVSVDVPSDGGGSAGVLSLIALLLCTGLRRRV